MLPWVRVGSWGPESCQGSGCCGVREAVGNGEPWACGEPVTSTSRAIALEVESGQHPPSCRLLLSLGRGRGTAGHIQGDDAQK